MSRRDYSSKTHKYQTPRKLVRRDKLKGEIIKKRLRFLAIVFTVCSSLSFFGYWLFFDPIFHLTNIIIENENGQTTHTSLLKKVNEILDNRVFFILPQSSYFLFSAKEAEKILNTATDYQQSIANITVRVKFPDTVTIGFQQKIPKLKVVVVKSIIAANEGQRTEEAAVADAEKKFKIESGYYLVDGNGEVVADEPQDEEIALPVAHLITKISDKFALGKAIFSQDAVSSTLALYDFFKLHSSLLPTIDYIELSDDNLMEAAVRANTGLIVHVSFKHSLQEELNRLLLTLENVKDKKVSYIDLRIENRAYVCCNLGLE